MSFYSSSRWKIKTLAFDYAYHTIFSFLHEITEVLHNHVTLQWPYSYVKLSTATIILNIIFKTDMTDSCIFSFLFNHYSKKFQKKLVRISQEDDNWESHDRGSTILYTDCAIKLLRSLLLFCVSTYWLLHFLFSLPFYFPIHGKCNLLWLSNPNVITHFLHYTSPFVLSFSSRWVPRYINKCFWICTNWLRLPFNYKITAREEY